MTYRLVNYKLSIVTSVAAMAFALPNAVAQDTGEDTESRRLTTVTVTSQKRDENVQDVPISIVAVPGEVLEEAGINSGADLTRLVPNLRVSRGGQTSSVAIRIRGVGASGNSAIDPSVAPFVDGVYLPRGGAILSSFLDVGTVEVLRGPQGTLFGRNATTGALVIRTNAPEFDTVSGEVFGEVGNFDAYRARGIVNVPLAENFAIRAAALVDHSEGYYENLLDGESYNGRNAFTGRLSARWQISDNIDWTVRGDYASDDGDNYLPPEVSSHQGPAAFVNAFGSVFGPLSANIEDPFDATVSQLITADHDDTQWGLSSDLVWDLENDYTVRWIGAVRNWENEQLDGDVVWTGLDLVNRRGFYESDSMSQELQLISPEDSLFGGRMDFVAGLYYFDEEYALGENLNLGSNFCSTLLPAGPQRDACLGLPGENATILEFEQDAESVAVFLDTNWNLTDSVELTLGGRFTSDDKTSTFEQQLLNPFAGSLRRPESENLDFSDDQFTYRVVLSWFQSDDVMWFGSYSTGYKSGGINSNGSSTALGSRRIFDSESVENIELGVKSTLADGRVQLNANAYRMEIEDFQDRSFQDASFITTNAGELRQQGVELETVVAATDNLTVDFALAYLDSEFTDFDNASPLPGCAVLPPPGTPECPNPQDNTGKRAPFSPEWQINAGAVYERDLFNGLTGRVALDWIYFGDHIAGGSELSPQAMQEGYNLFDGRVSISSPDDAWTFSVFGRNLTDERYATTHLTQVLNSSLGLVDTTTGETLYRNYVSPPRTYGASLSFRY